MPHLLLVDDDEDILSLLTNFFRKHSHTVSTAANGAAMFAALDKQPIDLVVLDVMLSSENGFDVLTAVDGQDAIQQLTEQTVDVVITDLEMPRVNGYALIEDLRRRSTTREVPVIVLTTRAGAKHVGLARRLGVRHYVAKPVEEQSFIRLVASVTSVPEAVLAVAGRSGTMAD